MTDDKQNRDASGQKDLTQREQVELRRLIDATLNETASDAEFENLSSKLERSAAARGFYVEYTHIHAAVRRHFLVDDDGTGALDASVTTGDAVSMTVTPLDDSPYRIKQGPWWQSRVFWGALSASLLIGILLGARALQMWQTSQGTVETAMTGNRLDVAVLADAIDVAWAAGASVTPSIGDALPPGLIQLDQGLVRIEFYGGAATILEGPAALEIQSPDRAYLHFGRLRTFVPERAKGFVIASPDCNVQDLGTEFGMQVSAEGTSEVHVLDGEVRVLPAGDDEEARLLTGDAVRLFRDGQQAAMESDANKFVGPDQFAARTASTRKRQFERWQAGIERLRSDPHLEALYSFRRSGAWGNTLVDEVPKADGTTQGAVVGCEWKEGRWPDKRALQFSNPSDRVRINVPGVFPAITLATWVKVDRLSNQRIAIMHPEETGDHYVHWTLVPVGGAAVIHFAVTDATGALPNRQHYNSKAHAVWPDEFGHWLHFAVTYNPEVGLVTHYKNGQWLGQNKIAEPQNVAVGVGDLGNWPYKEWAKGTQFAVRNFEGAMDEFAVFSRALAAGEIEQLYEFGKPSSSELISK